MWPDMARFFFIPRTHACMHAAVSSCICISAPSSAVLPVVGHAVIIHVLVFLTRSLSACVPAASRIWPVALSRFNSLCAVAGAP
jgi:hypothetical protein